MTISRRTALTLLAAASAGASPASAQAWPTKPLTIVVPYAAGSATDTLARIMAERLAPRLGQPVIVDNKGGGNGSIAANFVAKSAPDGYTLMQGYVATHGTSPATRKLPYDAIKDFTPIGMIGGTPNVLVVTANLPPANFQDFVAYVRKNPGSISYGSAGQGSLTHLTMELFKLQTNTFMTHIPYRGIAPAFTDLIGGQTQAMFPGLAAALPHIRSNRVRPLAVTGKARHPLLKDIPTLDELGLKGFEAMQWYGVVGPAGMPAAVVKHLNETLNAALSAPDMREKLSGEALEPQPMSPEQFGKYIREDIARWTRVAKERNIQLEN